MSVAIGIEVSKDAVAGILVDAEGRLLGLANRHRDDGTASDPVASWTVMHDVIDELVRHVKDALPASLPVGLTGDLDDLAALAQGSLPDSGRLPGVTPVITLTRCDVASALAAGAHRAGDWLMRFGGAGESLLCTTSPSGDDAHAEVTAHGLPGLFLVRERMACCGAVLNWILEELAQGEIQTAEVTGERPYKRLDQIAAEIEPLASAPLFLPHLLADAKGDHSSPLSGCLLGLKLEHTLGHVWRAALEGVAFGFRRHGDGFAALRQPISRIIAADGGASSRIWMQIVADVLQRPVHLVHTPTEACLGAAIRALLVGDLDRGEAMVERFWRPAATMEPDSDRAGLYDHRYAVYLEATAWWQAVSTRLAVQAPAPGNST